MSDAMNAEKMIEIVLSKSRQGSALDEHSASSA